MFIFQPVYRDECYTSPTTIKTSQFSQSFPDLRVLYAEASPNTLRRRAMSDCYGIRPQLQRSSSETDLNKIDKDATFALINSVQPSELLAKVVDALVQTEDNCEESETDDFEELGVQGFSDSEILKSEKYGSAWSLGQKSAGSDRSAVPPKVLRARAASEVKVPTISYSDNNINDWTWSGPAATKKIEEIRNRTKFDRPRVRTKSEETESSTRSWLERFRSSFRRRKNVEEDKKQIDLEKQQLDYLDKTSGGRRSTLSTAEDRYLNHTRSGRCSVFSAPENKMLEETSIADLLRAITSLHSRVGAIPEIVHPHRKVGNAGLMSQKMPSSLDLFTPPSNARLHIRRASVQPGMLTKRRFSLHPVSETGLPHPPPYSTHAQRRGSLVPGSSPGLMHKQITRLRATTECEMPKRTKDDSYKDVRIV